MGKEPSEEPGEQGTVLRRGEIVLGRGESAHSYVWGTRTSINGELQGSILYYMQGEAPSSRGPVWPIFKDPGDPPFLTVGYTVEEAQGLVTYFAETEARERARRLKMDFVDERDLPAKQEPVEA